MANNDFPHMLALQAAQAGLGILFCPISLGHNILRRGEQIQVLPEWQRYLARNLRRMVAAALCSCQSAGFN